MVKIKQKIMLYFILGIIVGVLLSMFSFIVGKKSEMIINHTDRYLPLKQYAPQGKMAEIITKKEPIKEFLES